MDPIAIVINWYKQRKERDGRTVASQPWNQQTIAQWCQTHFDGVKAIFHLLRIERRLGIHQLLLQGKFRLTESSWRPYRRGIGDYLLHGFKKHRRPE